MNALSVPLRQRNFICTRVFGVIVYPVRKAKALLSKPIYFLLLIGTCLRNLIDSTPSSESFCLIVFQSKPLSTGVHVPSCRAYCTPSIGASGIPCSPLPMSFKISKSTSYILARPSGLPPSARKVSLRTSKSFTKLGIVYKRLFKV